VEPHFVDVLRWERCLVDCTDAPTDEEVLERCNGEFQRLLKEADDRLLAVRVELTGPCQAHKKLAASPERYVNEIRSQAQELGGGDAWVEKVALRTTLPKTLDEALLSEGPVGELNQFIAELSANDGQLQALGNELADLKKKLPPELKEGPDGLDLDNPDNLRTLLHQVRQILISRLMPGGGEL
jgi:exonuclease SbcD